MKNSMIFTALLSMLTALPAQAETATRDMVAVSLIPGWRAADGTHVAGLQVRLAPGWKTYWRSPGDAGIPPQIDWTGSGNLAAAAIRWPVPVTFDINGMTSVGYTRDVILPLVLTPQQAGGAMRLEAQVTLGVCETICVPVDVHVSADLTPAGTEPDARLVAALAQVPQTEGAARVGRVSCDVAATKDGLRLVAEVAMPPLGAAEFAVVETDDPDIWVGEAVSRRAGNSLRIETEMQHVAGQPLALDRSGLRFTVLAGARAVEIIGCD